MQPVLLYEKSPYCSLYGFRHVPHSCPNHKSLKSTQHHVEYEPRPYAQWRLPVYGARSRVRKEENITALDPLLREKLNLSCILPRILRFFQSTCAQKRILRFRQSTAREIRKRKMRAQSQNCMHAVCRGASCSNGGSVENRTDLLPNHRSQWHATSSLLQVRNVTATPSGRYRAARPPRDRTRSGKLT